MVVDLRAHTPSGPTATLHQFADGRYDAEQGTVAITAGRVTFALPGLSIMQVIVPLVVRSVGAWHVGGRTGAFPGLPVREEASPPPSRSPARGRRRREGYPGMLLLVCVLLLSLRLADAQASLPRSPRRLCAWSRTTGSGGFRMGRGASSSPWA